MNDKLAQIIAHKRNEVAARKTVRIARELALIARETPEPRGFAKALDAAAADGFALIAEVKKASPSKGVIREDFHPRDAAIAYAAGGAACLSVLTDEEFFKGHDDYLRIARGAVSVPALRKDFTIDPWQVAEARAIGADAVLLILAAVDDDMAKAIEAEAIDFGLDLIIEVHDEAEMERALELQSPLIGINNRNLKTFETDLATSERLVAMIPDDRAAIAESGINTHADLERLSAHGIRRFLVGESLMRQPDIEAATRTLLHG
ncbi:indole-3-glycerol phosphate synthase TrpC [Novosphingopyxis baekryungensis]|uniref:indole-3-glycerol phosphate synthase TrpC n=1 Tax=Novosphingopyxis baekryungensis TaxID=279369 RepID=UPI0003B6F17C|nr:indole-3-glycerol phosphate synthase TrpC [Novosphingopyxis baekryungensis]